MSVTSTQVCAGSTTPPVITNSAAVTPVAKLTAASGLRHGGRDVQLPDYIASYEPEQVSSACNCLSMKNAAAATATTVEIITSTVPASLPLLT